ncbi:MAG: hypothetical protein AB7O57_18325 [Hyphomicrobiaceae bacterium]
MPSRSSTETVERGSTVGTLAFMLVGPLIWAAHFTFAYGYQSVACAIGDRYPVLQDNIVLPLVLATLLAAALLVFSLVLHPALETLARAASWQPPQIAFQRRVMLSLAVLSLFGVVAGGTAVLVLPPCAG